MKKLLLTLMIFSGIEGYSQLPRAPLFDKNYKEYTSYKELTDYIYQLGKSSKLLKIEIIGQSVNDRNLYALKYSSGKFGSDQSKIKVLIFAQQHGNEQSGKEGALLLAMELLKPENSYLFDRIDLVIVPQMNPDGSEGKKRLNGHDEDLNRNHLILTEPETIALHKLFDRYKFEVTMDVHEYYPFGDSWKKGGYRLNTDEFLGPLNNPNIAEDLKSLSNTSFLPFMKKYFEERKFTNFIYSPGGPPGMNYIRHSTFDINDGRQSFGILNSFSFIQEGINGIDYSADRLSHRSEGQKTGMRGLLEYVWLNKDEIKSMVSDDRLKLKGEGQGKLISIQCEHTGNGKKLDLPVYSYFTGTDSVVQVTDYRPVVRSITDVVKPAGYLIPKKSRDLIQWTERHSFVLDTFTVSPGDRIEQYMVESIDSIDFEGDKIVNPSVVVQEAHGDIKVSDYLYVPTAQLKGNFLVIALEPKSMLGLATYRQFSYLLKKGEYYPVLRVVR
jgi:hypothetical protein